ncbi:AzlC family ABC transporter permease [Rhodococcus sp. BP-252]|uniref:AzlC family ABC transporter permease n=1 Tax=unclassified Rhodococcus (in: high G+C Gram-positive bacteria) TaxID=192944 RepID=UPI001C9B4C10|nr:MULTISPECIES: AzlC family ABC transporter permease [unclassified Rhodococcus (in: high G+C Gram-positive bacteria)]MBY6411968.1 AzlC family ABC transporter permease [Rhodococcus sp. BP-320]MBY6416404.1 AzlC family ABC transporter permease [Rhodococcus sp. BP-321]MBY6420790.1 AzlC family ABC transporter permease [Rhodococcus sp. BP-324]MBY6426428.1 AzlC family ABC transporter permease [Rhodococcus sp. BP-323]MBY6431427.1 AzlC family ABC transporter permease [Rhodococcus sp. BP-322]
MTVHEELQPTTTGSFVDAFRSAGVIWFGLFTLGLGFGVVVTSHGFPWWIAPIISGVLFAGSVEFVLIGMLAAAAPLAAVAVTTFLVNSRHLFYGLSFPLHRVEGRFAKLYSIFALCDEAFAMITSHMRSGRILWTQLGLHMSWMVGSFLGGLAGHTVLGDVQGLDFVLTALFVVLVVDAYRADPNRVTLVLAVLSGAVGLLFSPGSMLVVSMCVFTMTLIVRHVRSARA